MRLADWLLLILGPGIRRGTGPPPKEGWPHKATIDWRPQCSHCWAFLIVNALLWWGIFIGITVAIVTCEGPGC